MVLKEGIPDPTEIIQWPGENHLQQGSGPRRHSSVKIIHTFGEGARYTALGYSSLEIVREAEGHLVSSHLKLELDSKSEPPWQLERG